MQLTGKLSCNNAHFKCWSSSTPEDHELHDLNDDTEDEDGKDDLRGHQGQGDMVGIYNSSIILDRRDVCTCVMVLLLTPTLPVFQNGA